MRNNLYSAAVRSLREQLSRQMELDATCTKINLKCIRKKSMLKSQKIFWMYSRNSWSTWLNLKNADLRHIWDLWDQLVREIWQTFVNRRCPLTFIVHMANITSESSLQSASATNHRKIANMFVYIVIYTQIDSACIFAYSTPIFF